MPNKSDKSMHPYIVPDLKRKIFSLPITYIVSWKVFLDAPCQKVDEVPLYFQFFFLRVLIHECWILSNTFCMSIETIVSFCPLFHYYDVLN